MTGKHRAPSLYRGRHRAYEQASRGRHRPNKRSNEGTGRIFGGPGALRTLLGIAAVLALAQPTQGDEQPVVSSPNPGVNAESAPLTTTEESRHQVVHNRFDECSIISAVVFSGKLRDTSTGERYYKLDFNLNLVENIEAAQARISYENTPDFSVKTMPVVREVTGEAGAHTAGSVLAGSNGPLAWSRHKELPNQVTAYIPVSLAGSGMKFALNIASEASYSSKVERGETNCGAFKIIDGKWQQVSVEEGDQLTWHSLTASDPKA